MGVIANRLVIMNQGVSISVRASRMDEKRKQISIITERTRNDGLGREECKAEIYRMNEASPTREVTTSILMKMAVQPIAMRTPTLRVHNQTHSRAETVYRLRQSLGNNDYVLPSFGLLAYSGGNGQPMRG